MRFYLINDKAEDYKSGIFSETEYETFVNNERKGFLNSPFAEQFKEIYSSFEDYFELNWEVHEVQASEKDLILRLNLASFGGIEGYDYL